MMKITYTDVPIEESPKTLEDAIMVLMKQYQFEDDKTELNILIKKIRKSYGNI